MAEQPERDRGGTTAPPPKDHLYGGQAVIEGVMMRGRDIWALAVRKPDDEIHIESHEIDSVAKKHPLLAKPGFRGVIVLGQSLKIGFRALTIAARVSSPEEVQLSGGTMGFAMALAIVLFIGIFIAFPAALFGWIGDRVGAGVWTSVAEGVFRVLLFLGYLAIIGQTKDIRRVFQYHGAEHKTIAAFEHDEPLNVENVGRYSTLHVRCGTNFLLIVMVLTILIFALFGSPPLHWRILSRIVAIPLIAAFAYEMLRLGARFPNSWLMRGLMTPGLWLQKITTKPPSPDQIEVAIASFNEVLRREAAASEAGGNAATSQGGEVATAAPDPAPGAGTS
ncbi:MAG: DUF1385 domain-containing protein [Actinomycetota bacterium]